ncbi:hypothetical protein [Pseudonocardia sp. ICBG601]|uniref:hypothetical protein n=1 Tax=Pseudonocardia sp. ICBG601 TaxID=2846759 RepID=UPI001CF6795B|nr:hypothetical protein [Pseudonocardia sp. ICBG601]
MTTPAHRPTPSRHHPEASTPAIPATETHGKSGENGNAAHGRNDQDPPLAAESTTVKVNPNDRIGTDRNSGTGDSGVAVGVFQDGSEVRVSPSDLKVIYEIVSVESAQEMARLRMDQARVLRAVVEWVAQHARDPRR